MRLIFLFGDFPKNVIGAQRLEPRSIESRVHAKKQTKQHKKTQTHAIALYRSTLVQKS